jgi:hypothetical protein
MEALIAVVIPGFLLVYYFLNEIHKAILLNTHASELNRKLLEQIEANTEDLK